MRDVAFAIGAGVVLGLGALAAPAVANAGSYREPPQPIARTDAKTLVQVVDTWRVNDYAKRGAQCPSIELLKYDGALKADQNTNDPWGMPYIVFCPHDDDVTVMSAGPDRRYGTADDITAGAAP